MTSNLRNIKDLSPNQNTIDILKQLLSEAERGELRSVLVVQAYDDSSVTHSWSIDHRSSVRMIVSELVMAQHDFVVNVELLEGDSDLVNVLGG